MQRPVHDLDLKGARKAVGWNIRHDDRQISPQCIWRNVLLQCCMRRTHGGTCGRARLTGFCKLAYLRRGASWNRCAPRSTDGFAIHAENMRARCCWTCAWQQQFLPFKLPLITDPLFHQEPLVATPFDHSIIARAGFSKPLFFWNCSNFTAKV